jgi:molybdopterin/thiamine biosynthesis adenylyltransferase
MNKQRQLTEYEQELYARNILIPEIGQEGQLALLESRVLVVGAGGLGSPALFYLAAAGVGDIGIADGDKVEMSNLQRQILHGTEDIDVDKTESAKEALMSLRPDLNLQLYPFRLDVGNAGDLAAEFDFVVDASDSFESKFLINDACVRANRPFSHAGIRGLFGQTMTVLPGRSPCYRCVFQEEPEPGKVKGTAEAGVLGCVPGVLGAIQATEAVKYLVGMDGLLTGRLLTYNAASMVFREIKLPPDRRCDTCRDAAVNREDN